jgi:peptide/nickel transport system substrate-binding protein
MHWTRRKLLASAAPLALAPGWLHSRTLDPSTLVVGTTQRPRLLNSAVVSGTATMIPAGQLFASLFKLDRNWRYSPYLAQAWETSPDGLEMNIRIRQNAYFHDGAPITSADVQFSILSAKQFHPFKTMLDPVDTVIANGPHALRVKLKQAHPAMMVALSSAMVPILPKHVFGQGGDLITHPRNADPVGSGPFKLVSFKPGEGVELERFDRFFEPGRSSIRQLVIREYRDSAVLLLAFERGEIDIHQGLTDPREIMRAKRVGGAMVHSESSPALGPLCWLAFNTRHPVLSDVRVRKAINYAIDKQFILDRILGGVHKRSTGPLAASSPFYSADVEPYKFDPARARSLLDAAGFRPKEDGVRFRLSVDALPGSADLRTIQDYIKTALADIGISIEVRSSADFPTWAQRVGGHAFDMTLDLVFNWGDPIIGVHRTWASSNIRPGVIWSNTQSYANPNVDRLLEQAGVTMDATRRRELYGQIQKTVVDDSPVAFLYELVIHEAYQQRIKAVAPSVWGIMGPLHDLEINV